MIFTADSLLFLRQLIVKCLPVSPTCFEYLIDFARVFPMLNYVSSWFISPFLGSQFASARHSFLLTPVWTQNFCLRKNVLCAPACWNFRGYIASTALGMSAGSIFWTVYYTCLETIRWGRRRFLHALFGEF